MEYTYMKVYRPVKQNKHSRIILRKVPVEQVLTDYHCYSIFIYPRIIMLLIECYKVYFSCNDGFFDDFTDSPTDFSTYEDDC